MGFRDNDLWKTSLSMGASAFFYPGQGGQTRSDYFSATSVSRPPPSNATGHFTLSETWLPKADWAVTASGNFFRTQDLLGNVNSPTNDFGLGTPGATASTFNSSFIPSIAAFLSQQQYTNMYGGQVSVQKTINERTSLSASEFVQAATYSSAPRATQYGSGAPVNSSGSAPDGMSYGTSLRGTFYATPQIYVFVQPTVSFQRFVIRLDDSDGWSARAGVGSNLIGLFRGEIHGGWQSQSSVYGNFGTQSAPAFGADISYFPTPLLTLALRFQQALGGMASMGAGSAPIAANRRTGIGYTQQISASANYGLNSYMDLTVQAGLGQTQNQGGAANSAALGFARFGFAGSNAANQIVMAMASLRYNFWRNTTISLSYNFRMAISGGGTAFLSSNSNLAPGYTQNIFTAGIRYSY